MNNRWLILITTVILSIILIMSFVGTIVYSASQISYNVTESQSTPHITKQLDPLSYDGYVKFNTDVNIENNGIYDISNMQIDYRIYAYNWSTSNELNNVPMSQGIYKIGTIISNTAWSGNFEVNITNHIANLAIQNCDFKAIFDFTFIYHPIVSTPHTHENIVYDHYTAPL